MFFIFFFVDHLTPGLYHTRSPSSDTLDISSVDSLSLDEHITMVAPPSNVEIVHPVSAKTLAPPSAHIPVCLITRPSEHELQQV